jgi:uncharacterized protein YbcI
VWDLQDPGSQPDQPLDPEADPRQEVVPDADAIAAELRDEIAAIHRDSYGKGAAEVKAYLLDNVIIVILEDLELLPNEEFMIEQGQAGAVAELRRQFQRAIEPTFRAAAERATGRRVIGFVSHAHLEEPRFSVEVFRLEPKS